MSLEAKTLADLVVDDAEAFAHVAFFDDLRTIVRDAKLPFLVAKPGSPDATWGRALLYNLTFWNAAAPADVLHEPRVPADVVMHAAWHHLARLHVAPDAAPRAEALFLGESIASAFDLYLVGRLLDRPGGSAFLETQVPALAEAAEQAGMSDADFEALLEATARDPEGAFESLRQLLFDASCALHASRDALEASQRLEALRGHPHHAILHHYELSTWVLYARAYSSAEPCAKARELDARLRAEADALGWLDRAWVRPALRAPSP